MPKANHVAADIKQQILKRMKEDGIPVAQLAQEHGISDKTIYGWVNKGLTEQPSLIEVSKFKRENRALREMLGKVLFESAMAQKALAMVITTISKIKRAIALGISRSMLYYEPKQEKKDWALKIKIEEVLHDNSSYGHKRLSDHLKINKKRIRRVMKKYGIKPYRRRGKKYRKSKENGCVFPNLLLTNMPSYQNHIWACDFTHLSWKDKTIYLATIIDIFTREIVGFSVMMNHWSITSHERLTHDKYITWSSGKSCIQIRVVNTNLISTLI